MRPRRAALFLVALLLGACGGSSGKGAAAPPTPAVTEPSVSAKMVCADEAQADIAAMLGTKTTEPVSPTWADQTYSCRYVYGDSQLVLSVRELANKDATDKEFRAREKQLGRQKPLDHVGDAAFVTPTDSIVVRKDFKVLSVDVSKLPQAFGSPPSSRATVAMDVAAVIMGCWTGA